MKHQSGLPKLSAKLIRGIGDRLSPRGKGDGRLCIVNYHRVLERLDPLLAGEPDIATFRWQMELLADCFHLLPLDQAVQMLATERMPARAVAITFDDGYRSIHDLALPILREFDVPATVFVVSGCLDGGSMWNDIILEAFRRLPNGELDLHDIGLGTYPLHGLKERKHSLHALTEACKYLAPVARLELTRKLESLTGHPLQSGGMLNREMVGSLADAGICIGGHTISHPILTRIDDDMARFEINENKRELESLTGRPISVFAYPNGKKRTDFDQRHLRMVEEAGYSAAFTTAGGAATARHPRFAMPRGRPWDTTPTMFAARLLRWLAGRA
jgi:peptidoglycan/xylan/chitin deacetylase (PgdA/CDA1 family)